MTSSPAVLAERTPAVPAVQVLQLVEPLPGFPRYSDYVLVAAEDGGRLFWLQSVAPDGPRLLAVLASAFFPEYIPRVPDAVRLELDLADDAQAGIYCVVTTPGGEAAAATANLRAPVVVNPVTGRTRQVLLPDAVHPIRRPLRR